MQTIAMVVHAGKFLKELEESTSGREPVRAAARQEARAGGRPDVLGGVLLAMGRRLRRGERGGSPARPCDAGASAA